VLLDPFEEQLHLPSAPVELSDGQRRKHEVVGQKDQCLVGDGIVVFDAPEFCGVATRRVVASQHNDLVGSQPRFFLDGIGIQTTALEIGLGADHEERCALIEMVEAFEIEISPVHDVKRPWLRDQVIEDIDVVKLPVAYVDEGGNAAPEIQEGVEFDGAFASPELCPWKNGQAQIDGGGVEGIDGLSELDAKVFVDVESPRRADQAGHTGRLRCPADSRGK